MEDGEAAEFEALLAPYFHIAQNRGKEVRTALIDAFNEWLRVDAKVLVAIRSLVEKLHNASLMIDDIEDGSRLRRGQPASHMVFGVPMTINSATYVIFLAMQEIVQLGSFPATSAAIEEMLNLHKGQGMDIFWRDAFQCPTEEQYQEMVQNKTGGLFRLAVRVMQEFSDDKRDYVPLLNALGLYFQILDDLLNVSSEKMAASKSFADDLSEGKFSFVVVYTCQRARDRSVRSKLLNILKQRTQDAELKRFAVELMEQSGAFTHAVATLERLRGEIGALIQGLGGGNERLERVLSALHEQIPKRLQLQPAVPTS